MRNEESSIPVVAIDNLIGMKKASSRKKDADFDHSGDFHGERNNTCRFVMGTRPLAHGGAFVPKSGARSGSAEAGSPTMIIASLAIVSCVLRMRGCVLGR